LRSSGRCSQSMVFRSGLGRCHLLRHIVGNLSYRFSVFHRITRVSTPDGQRRSLPSFVYRGIFQHRRSLVHYHILMQSK
jgi:hypothetical protein